MIWENRGLDANKKVNGRKRQFLSIAMAGYGLPMSMQQITQMELLH
jgi:hypothetical protein